MRSNSDTTESQQSLSKSGGETILLVEDDPLIRNLGCRLLETFRYKVYVADSIAQAQQSWDEHRGAINLIICDVMLPDGKAPEMIQRFRTDKPHMKVIYTSGYGDEILAGDEDERRGTSFVQKPFHPDDLLQHVRAALKET